MPHTYTFNPPLRGSRAGPLLRMPVPEPKLEGALVAGRIDNPHTPYRKNTDVENLLDIITLGVRPCSVQEGLLVLSLGLFPFHGAGGAGMTFVPSHRHIHLTDEPMRPDVLLSHSVREGSRRVVGIAMMEELSLLAASLLRELGYSCYLSTITAPTSAETSSLSVFHDGILDSFIISGAHPAVSKLTIFEDREVLHILDLLKGYNDLKRLQLHLETKGADDEGRERYARLMRELGSGCVSGHHASDILLRELGRLCDSFPQLLAGDLS